MEKKFVLVFVHGLLGFDKYGLPGFSINYFRGVPRLLSRNYEHLYFPRIPAVGSVKHRATSLAYSLDKIDSDYICVVGHSMGGLDARYVISQLDPNQKIKHLITLGTPHQGSPVANWILNEGGMVNKVLRKITHPGVYDLTPESCEKFNRDVVDREDVYYESFAAARPPAEMATWFLFDDWTERLLENHAASDSLVSVDSARWGHFSGVVRADHFELIGWNLGGKKPEISRPFDHHSFYLSIAQSAHRRYLESR
ncbi:MAG: lipase family alpha/beta hydrolase [Gammaproteobacteria bacterium]